MSTQQKQNLDFFDPRKTVDESSNRIWSTKSVALCQEAMAQGAQLKEYPFFAKSKDVLLRRANLPFRITPEEREILSLVMDDILLWADNFPSLKNGNNGWTKIKLREYQRNLLNRYKDNVKNILLFPRQAGKTTTTVLDIVYFILTNTEKDMIIVASSDDIAAEILKKVKECIGSLPFYMQPGVVSWTNEGFVLDSGVRLRCKKASESVAQGFSIDYLFIDEFAYIDKKVAQKFWTNIYPTLSANPDAKCIIASTPNGRNLFHTLWSNAVAGKSFFVPYRIHWTDVPRPNQEAYKKAVIADVGLEAWLMGYELSFDTSIVSVFNTKIQELLRKSQSKHQKCWSIENNPYGEEWGMEFRNSVLTTTIIDEVEIEVDGISVDFDNDHFVASIDLAEGLGKDSTIIKLRKCVWDVEKKRLEYKVVGVYRNNEISVEDFATHSLKIFKKIKNLRVVLETNTYGAEYMLQVKHLITSKVVTDFNQFVFARFMDYSEKSTEALAKNDYHIGVKWNRANKPVAVKSYVTHIKDGIFDETYYQTIEEQLNFGKSDGKGTNNIPVYCAQVGNDDLVMVDVTMSYWLQSGSHWVTDYLDNVELILRFNANDRKQEIIDAENAAIQKERNIYRVDDWIIRNHEEQVEDKKANKVCLLL